MSDNVPLNLPVIEALPDPQPHNPPAGDWSDDDGEAIDSYFEAAAQGAQIYQMVKALVDSLGGPKASRLIARTFDLTINQAGPVRSLQALTQDDNRSTLVIQPIRDTAKAGVYLSEQSFAIFDGPDTVGRVTQAFYLPPGAQLVLPNYTGPLWIGAGALDGTQCRVDVMAVTY